MITVEQHEKLIDKISKLSELELDDLLKDIGLHLRKNNLEHLINNAFVIDDFEGEIEALQDQVSRLESDKDELTSNLGAAEDKIQDAIDALGESEEVYPIQTRIHASLKIFFLLPIVY